MKIKLTNGNNNKLNNLSIQNLLIITYRQFLTDRCLWMSLLIGILVLLGVFLFQLKIKLAMSLLFGPSVTALSFSFAMMSAAKLLFPDDFLSYLAHDSYKESEINEVYVIFSPFVLGSISWGILAIMSLIGISLDFSFIKGFIRSILEVIVIIISSFSVLNLIQLMWIIIRLTIEKAFSDL